MSKQPKKGNDMKPKDLLKFLEKGSEARALATLEEREPEAAPALTPNRSIYDEYGDIARHMYENNQRQEMERRRRQMEDAAQYGRYVTMTTTNTTLPPSTAGILGANAGSMMDNEIIQRLRGGL